MYKLEFGQEIRNIYLIPDTLSYDKIFVFKMIVIETSQFIILEPKEETDEIKLSTKEFWDKSSEKKALKFEGLINRRLVGLWHCKNDNGYLDQIIIGVDVLRPTLSFLCECGLLGVFNNKALDSKNFVSSL